MCVHPCSTYFKVEIWEEVKYSQKHSKSKTKHSFSPILSTSCSGEFHFKSTFGILNPIFHHCVRVKRNMSDKDQHCGD